MVISSLVVETLPDKTVEAASALAEIEGAEVHELNGSKAVVTIEAETVGASHAIAASFTGVEGVLNVNLVYVNFEDDPSLTGRSTR